MKKFLALSIIIGSLWIPGVVSAQFTSCQPVTAGNYGFCCGVAAGNANIADCKAYNNGYSTGNPDSQTTTTTTPPSSGGQCYPVYSFTYDACCNSVGGATVNKIQCDIYTSHQYTPGTVGAGGSGTINTTIPAGTEIAATPQSGSTDLAQCSKIKFISLLDILIWVKCIIVVAIIPLIFALALLFFLWGVTKFIGASDSTKKEEGKKFIMGGLIGLFVMTSLWGIIKIVSTTLGTGSAVPLLQTECLTTNGCTPTKK